MELFAALMETLNNFIWGPPMMVLLLGVGTFLTIGLRFISILKIRYGFRQLFKKRSDEAAEGDVSPFAALMTALSSTVGTGNIAGVAAAIAIGARRCFLDVDNSNFRHRNEVQRGCVSCALPRN